MARKNRPSASHRPASSRRHQLESQAEQFLASYHRRDFANAERQAEAITLDFPKAVFGWKALGTCLLEAGRTDKALTPLQRALELNEKDVEVLANLGKTLRRLGRYDEAHHYLTRALEFEPDNHQAHLALAEVLSEHSNYRAAIEHLDRSIEVTPDNALPQMRKATALVNQRDYDGALAILEPLAEQQPRHVGVQSNLANLYSTMGRFDEAEHHYWKAVERSPHAALPYSNYYFTAHYNPRHSAEDFLAMARDWQQRYSPDQRPERPATSKEPGRPLRVGLVSSGLRTHPVGQMITTALEQIHASQLSFYAYSDKLPNDPIAQRIQRCVAAWHDVGHLSDTALADKIREDEIDVLIDLTGHTSGNRLAAMATEPAPLMVKWVGGLFNTVGLEAFDYLISDSIETPPGVDYFYLEKLIRLPDDYICYMPTSDAPPVAKSLPALQNGHITLGCFNNPAKLNQPLMAEWAQLMHQLPDSQLFLKGGQFTNQPYCERIYQSFEKHGIGRERVLLEGPSSHAELMKAYDRVDIALDTWPYSGGLTTCEALLMGVPVVTLPGPTFAGRHSATHLVNAGLPELVAESWDEYRQRVLELVSDLGSLRLIRQGLRQQLLESPVCDAPRFARHLNTALRAIWQRYCDGKAPEALTLTRQGAAWFKGEETPVEVQHPEPTETNDEFKWQLSGKIIVIDNSAKLVREPQFERLHALNAFGIVAFDAGSRIQDAARFEGREDVQLFQHALLGDGQPATLHATLEPAFSSTLKPLPPEQQLSDECRAATQVLTELPINTVALDSIEGLESLDWLLLDELCDAATILEHGSQALRDALLIEARIALQPTHERQPSLDEIRHWASRNGFRFYRFERLSHRSHLPVRDDLRQKQSTELVTVDAVFIPSQERMAALTDTQRSRLAFLLYTIYGIRDLTHELLAQVDAEQAEAYLAAEGITGQETKPRPESLKTKHFDDPTIFIVGCGHSGTTVLASILGAHPEVYCIPRETYWFLNKPYVMKEYPAELERCKAEGKQYVCEKTPRHIYRIDEIQKVFPNARFVAITRDAKDVVASLKNRTDSFDSAVARWINDNNKLLKHSHQDNVLTIRYEDLVTEQEKTMRTVLSFLDLDYTAEVFDFHKKDYGWFGVKDSKETDGKGERNHLIRRSWQMTQPLHDRRGVWREHLTSTEAQRVDQATGSIRSRLGY